MKARSLMSLSNTKALTCDMGELVPVGLTEVLPGDTFQQSSSAFLRMQPMLAPIMGVPVTCSLHHFFVPTRILWEDFESFITGGEEGDDESVHPTITFAGGIPIGSLGDYLGLPTGVNGITVSAIPFRAYALIYNDWYRDSQLQTRLALSLASGPDSTTSVVLKNRNWEKDYFTSARPFEQLGPSVSIPLGGTIPIDAVSDIPVKTSSLQPTMATTGGTGAQWANAPLASYASGAAGLGSPQAMGSGTHNVFWGNETGMELQIADIAGKLEGDLSGSTAVNIRVLREALALQRFEEARNMYGGRYVELLRAWGVNSSDARLQRPEYLAGGQNNIQISEVLATAETDDVVVGDLKGHGIGGVRSNRYRRYFEEHGYVLTLMSVKPRTMYVQGIPRTWNRRTKEDYFNPEFQFVGQQPILNKELYAAHGSPDGVFGYQDRFDEYRRIENTVAGEFRDTLDFWGLWRLFDTPPALNSAFIESVPSDRIFAVPSADVLQVQVKHSIQARRKVAAHVTPKTF